MSRIRIAQDYDMDAEKMAAHFGLPSWRIQAVFYYYGAFPQENDESVTEARSETFQTLKRKLPHLERQEFKC